MFSINIYIKFALIAIFLLGGISLALVYGLGYSWILILIGLSCVFVPFFMDENQRINDESYYNKKNKES